MLNTKFKKLVIFVSVLLLQPMVNPGSFALAKKRKAPMKAYSFIAEGGKASQAECDGVRKLPRLKRLAEFSKANSYMGSELQTPELEIKGKANGEMWTHFFKTKPACNAVLVKTPSALEETKAKAPKPELPPDDADDEVDQPDQPEKPEQTEQSEQTEGPDSE